MIVLCLHQFQQDLSAFQQHKIAVGYKTREKWTKQETNQIFVFIFTSSFDSFFKTEIRER